MSVAYKYDVRVVISVWVEDGIASLLLHLVCKAFERRQKSCPWIPRYTIWALNVERGIVGSCCVDVIGRFLRKVVIKSSQVSNVELLDFVATVLDVENMANFMLVIGVTFVTRSQPQNGDIRLPKYAFNTKLSIYHRY